MNEEVFNTQLKELENQTLNYFKRNNIAIPTDVENSILDVFNENKDRFEMRDDLVNIYFKEDLEQFESDLTLHNNIEVNIDKNKSSAGNTFLTFTYYGNIDYVRNEKTEIFMNDELIDTPTDFNTEENTKVNEPEDWAIVVLEELKFSEGEYSMEDKIYIYCPISGEEVE